MLRNGRKDTPEAKRVLAMAFEAKAEFHALMAQESGGGDAPQPEPAPPEPTPVPERVAYRARLGPADHFDPAGVRLTKINAILLRDRSNFYAGRGDGEDSAGLLFENSDKRSGIAYRRIVPVGLLGEALKAAVVNHTAMVEVEITPKELQVRLLQPIAAAAGEKVSTVG